jgi:hypothetical protein
VIGNRRSSPITVAVLKVRTALPYERKTQALKQPADLARLQNWQAAHKLTYLDHLRTHELSIQSWVAIL